ncbi:MAG: YfhO family protein [Limisphaerales bacterium]
MNLSAPKSGVNWAAVEAHRGLRLGILLAGLVLMQLLVFWPSLIGTKVLLPVDVLGFPKFYPIADTRPWQDYSLSDLVLSYEPFRQFAAAEFREGRIPMWHPGLFGGTPFAQFGKFSPYNFIYYAAPGPVALAWIQLIKSVVLGCGAYLFLRRVAKVSFWPAAAGAWCLPWTGFFVVWQGYPVSWVASWYPWLLLATDSTIRRPTGWGAPALAGVTATAILTGHVDVAAQLLLGSGVYALWCCGDAHGWRPGRMHVFALGAVTAGWLAGMLLSTPYLLPLLEYVQTGARLLARGDGQAAIPPIGWKALPQLLIPDFYGHSQNGSGLVPPSAGNLMQGPAAGYAGLIASLVLAPLAWCNPRNRSLTTLLLSFVVLGWSWDLNLPGFTTLLQLPVLRMLSHDRLVCVATFAIMVLAALGLETLRAGLARWQRVFFLPLLGAAALGLWCLGNFFDLPEPIRSQLEEGVKQGQPAFYYYRTLDAGAVATIQGSFLRAYLRGMALCGVALGVWWALRLGRLTQPRWAVGLAVVWLAELLRFGWGFNPQCDRAYYYPPSPLLERLKQLPPGRVMPVDCLPANLLASQGFLEVRGYDGVDPQRVVELIELTRDRDVKVQSKFPETKYFVPEVFTISGGRVEFAPALSLFHVRYAICWGNRPPELRPLIEEGPLWVMENAGALPRAYVPASVRQARAAADSLRTIFAPGFAPRQTALVEVPMNLGTNCAGRAEVVAEKPSRVELRLDMQTDGLVVLADQWNDGWRATLDDQPVPIHRANHALRGVIAPAGTHRLVFEYAPASFVLGVRLMWAGVALVLLGAGLAWRSRQRAIDAPLTSPSQ